jgi:hypothetical protein
MTANARDVIAHKLHEWNPVAYLHLGKNPFDHTDAILAALADAGYKIVQRDAPLPPTPGPFNPFGEQDGE